MKIYVTGISGFVGHHFLEMLGQMGERHQVLGTWNSNQHNLAKNRYENLDLQFEQINLLDKAAISKSITEFQPDYVLHLAARSSIAESWRHPDDCISENITMFLHLLEAVRDSKLTTRILSIGSCEEYGPGLSEPITEDIVSTPINPYGVARVMQAKLVQLYYNSFGLDVIHVRAFNHFGPFQKPIFVLPSFANQIAAQIKQGKEIIELSVGNVEVIRDFTDVRDVVKAYWALFEKGKKGEVYNMCSGVGYQLKEVLKSFEQICGKPIHYQINPDFIRPTDNPILIGDNTKIKEATGWQPEIPMQQSLKDLLDYFLQKN